jgi:hypothetical protein
MVGRSDADPQVLAEYVLALIRADKPADKEDMVGQLSEFLREG